MGDTIRLVSPGLTLQVPDYVEPAPDDIAIDSAVSVLRGGGLTILVDAGPFSDPLSRYAGRPNQRVSTSAINGQPALVVSFVDDDGVRHLAARFLDRGVTIVVQLAKDGDLTVAQQVLDSATFLAERGQRCPPLASIE